MGILSDEVECSKEVIYLKKKNFFFFFLVALSLNYGT